MVSTTVAQAEVHSYDDVPNELEDVRETPADVGGGERAETSDDKPTADGVGGQSLPSAGAEQIVPTPSSPHHSSQPPPPVPTESPKFDHDQVSAANTGKVLKGRKNVPI